MDNQEPRAIIQAVGPSREMVQSRGKVRATPVLFWYFDQKDCVRDYEQIKNRQ